jgi:hypothetical protein
MTKYHVDSKSHDLKQREGSPLSERKILTLISEQFAIPMDLLAAFLGIDHDAVESLMEGFAERRWVAIRRFFVNDERWVWLTKDGAGRCGSRFAANAPEVQFLLHHRAVCEARLDLERDYPDGVWICERSLWKRRHAKEHAPDAVFKVRDGAGRVKQWAIEVERTPKTKALYGEILAHRYAHYHRVLYYCTPKVARRLKKFREFNNSRVMVIDALSEEPETKNLQWKISPASRPYGLARREIEQWEARAVRLIAEQLAIPLDQFARFIQRDQAAAQLVADHLEEAGYVCQGLGPVGQGPWLWVTRPAVRIAETGLKYVVPGMLTVAELRALNEARLFIQERDPDAVWWSKRILRRGNTGAIGPAGLVRSGNREYAVEIEPNSRNHTKLVDKYERRCAEYKRENRDVVVLCPSRHVELFTELKEQHGWENFSVEACPAFGKGRRRKVQVTQRKGQPRPARPRKEHPLVRIDPANLPAEALIELQKAEGTASQPEVTLAVKRRGRGSLRFRVTTERNIWRLIGMPQGWHISLASEQEKAEAVQPHQPRRKRRKRDRWPLDPPGVMTDIDPAELPVEAVDAIQKAVGSPIRPRVLSASQRRGNGALRFRVETDMDTWRVSLRPQGWSASLSH